MLGAVAEQISSVADWGDKAKPLEEALARVLEAMPEVGEEDGGMIAVDNGSAPAAMLSAEVHLRASSAMMVKAAAALQKVGSAAEHRDVLSGLRELEAHLTLRDVWSRGAQLQMEKSNAAESATQAEEVVKAAFKAADQAAKDAAIEALNQARAAAGTAADAYEAAKAKLKGAGLDIEQAERGAIFPRQPPAAQVGMPSSAALTLTLTPTLAPTPTLTR